MKIPGGKEDIQGGALKLLDPRLKSSSPGLASKETQGTVLGQIAGTDSVSIDAQFGTALGSSLDPGVMAAERRAKVDDIKKRVQNGTYVLPPSEDIAAKLAEELDFEIMTSAKDGTTDKSA